MAKKSEYFDRVRRRAREAPRDSLSDMVLAAIDFFLGDRLPGVTQLLTVSVHKGEISLADTRVGDWPVVPLLGVVEVALNDPGYKAPSEGNERCLALLTALSESVSVEVSGLSAGRSITFSADAAPLPPRIQKARISFLPASNLITPFGMDIKELIVDCISERPVIVQPDQELPTRSLALECFFCLTEHADAFVVASAGVVCSGCVMTTADCWHELEAKTRRSLADWSAIATNVPGREASRSVWKSFYAAAGLKCRFSDPTIFWFTVDDVSEARQLLNRESVMRTWSRIVRSERVDCFEAVDRGGNRLLVSSRPEDRCSFCLTSKGQREPLAIASALSLCRECVDRSVVLLESLDKRKRIPPLVVAFPEPQSE